MPVRAVRQISFNLGFLCGRRLSVVRPVLSSSPRWFDGAGLLSRQRPLTSLGSHVTAITGFQTGDRFCISPSLLCTAPRDPLRVPVFPPRLSPFRAATMQRNKPSVITERVAARV
ncbi:hypothetical protein VZT92_014048 [Zoarces viviparus]|uniref:Uncharacterized protein n=1 Tax=Zoarces viviparus TaxID=48416 RepID=A0AAW1F008_ZOAVI